MTKKDLLHTAAVVCVCAPLAAQPVLDRMQPRGARPGGAARLVLEGKGLGPDPKLLAESVFSATPLSGKRAAGMGLPTELVFLIELATDAVPGIYPVRVETGEGISNALLFTVGPHPQVQEEESQPDMEGEEVANDFPDTAQPITVPVTVEGRLEGPERDVFSFRAKKDESIVVEVAARRIGSAIDPHIELLAGDGSVLKRNGDSPGLGLDSRLAFEAPEDGEYFVTVRDERYSTQDQDFYRLTVGDYKFADSVFPLGWTREESVRAEFYGGNLAEALHGDIDLSSVPGDARETWVPVPGTPSSLPFLVSDGEEALESGSSRALRDGVVMNGRIAANGETDRYSLAVKSGEQWAFELHSGELPGSSLYGVMTIASGGGVLAVAGKHAGDPDPYVITSTGQTATFPFVNLAVPPDVTELAVSVEDLLGRGGPGFAYRLLARKQGPDFLLRLNQPYLNIPRDGSAILLVTAERRGYNGPIELYVANAPDDLEVSGGQIPPRSTLGNTLPRFTVGVLTLTPKPGADLRRLDLEIRGRAVEEGQEHLDRRAAGPGMTVAVKGTTDPSVTAEWLGYGLPARINPEQPAYLEFQTPRRLRLVRGSQGLVSKWAYHSRGAGVQVKKKVEIPRNVGSLRLRRIGDGDSAESGEFRMFTHERTSLGMVNYNLSTTVSADGREFVVYSKPLEVDIVDGYGLMPLSTGLEMQSGAAGDWEGEIWRDPEFKRTVSVTAVGLPAGVQCEQEEVAGDATGYRLQCETGADVAPGEYEVEIRAESMLSDEGTTRYLVEPVTAKLTIRN